MISNTVRTPEAACCGDGRTSLKEKGVTLLGVILTLGELWGVMILFVFTKEDEVFERANSWGYMRIWGVSSLPNSKWNCKEGLGLLTPKFLGREETKDGPLVGWVRGFLWTIISPSKSE